MPIGSDNRPVAEVAEELKAESDRLLHVDPPQALNVAKQLVDLGERAADPRHTYPPAPGDQAADLRNQTGWAEWSGTSFSTAIAAGLAAGYWTVERSKRPGLDAATVLSEFHGLAKHYAPAVRTASVAVRGHWEAAKRP